MQLLRGLLTAVSERTAMQIAWCKLCHVDERHSTGIETEQEHIPCKFHAWGQAQIQIFQLLDDFQGKGTLDGLVDAGIDVLER